MSRQRKSESGQSRLIPFLFIMIMATSGIVAAMNSTMNGSFTGSFVQTPVNATKTIEETKTIEIWANTSIDLEVNQSFARALLTLDNGSVLNGQEMKFYLNGGFVESGITDLQGFTEIGLNLDSGSHLVKAEFEGNPSMFLNPSETETGMLIGNVSGPNATLPIEELPMNLSSLVQGEIEIGSPVEWARTVSVTNPANTTIYNHSLQLSVPQDALGIRVFRDSILISNSSEVLIPEMEPNESISLEVKFYTPPVKVDILELDLDLISLLPPEARNIQVFEKDRLIASYPTVEKAKLVVPGMERKIFVYHNSSLHYHNLTVEIPSETRNITFFEERGEGIKDITDKVEFVENRVRWFIPRLSGVNGTIVSSPGIEKTQGLAAVGEPVDWILKMENLTVEYQTPAPGKEEQNIATGKRVV
ncbi:MAG: hypothetical protein V3U72_05245, partial [Candidatus Aenigmarchaeota archaeon]